MAIEFLTLGALRYDIDELRQLLEHLKMFIPQELIDESPFYQRVKRETRAEALAEGRVEAKAELLRALLTHRFPELAAEASAISVIKGPQRLQALFEAGLKSESAQDAQRAFRNDL